jgi:transposase
MQTRRNNQQEEMMVLGTMEALVPPSHRLRRLDRVLDLSFIHEAVRDKYCQSNGRASIDPEVIVRLFLLQAIRGIDSVRELMEEVHVNMAYRWFIGYDALERLPDHSTLSKALDRFGDEVFNELFRRSVEQCEASGLTGGKVMHVDATTIRADIDKDRVGRDDSSDRDARFGRFPDGTIQPGYKQQTVVDGKRGVVLAVAVAPANHMEGSSALEIIDAAITHLGEAPEVVCADSAYAHGENAAGCEERGIRLVSPPRRPRNHHSQGYFSVERFRYDETRDEFICPAGEVLRNVGRFAGRRQRRKYRGSQAVCQRCLLKARCTSGVQRCLNVSVHHGALVRLRADSRTDSFRQLYRSRAPVVEGVFAEGKQWHGLRRAWRRGLSNMKVQSLIVMTVLNLKRLAACLPLISGLNWLWRRLQALIESHLRLLGSFVQYYQVITQYAR